MGEQNFGLYQFVKYVLDFKTLLAAVSDIL